MRKLLALAGAVAALMTQPSATFAGPAATGSVHDLAFEAIDGAPMPLSSFRGKVLLIVNTASFCGFTKQYDGLQKLYESREAKGLVVIGAPSNDFGGQEPKAESEIAAFCRGAFGVTFPLTSKVAVTGRDAHPFYRFARDALGPAAAPRWNFHKYLVGRDGRLVAAFGTSTEPDAPQLIAAVDAELAKGE